MLDVLNLHFENENMDINISTGRHNIYCLTMVGGGNGDILIHFDRQQLKKIRDEIYEVLKEEVSVGS